MNKIKVLVVEDEIIIADHLCDTLEELGYEALEPAINYSEALEQIEIEKPDIAILDIELGGRKTGIDLAEKINYNFHFPFIFLTSNTDSLTLEKAKKVNPPAYLVKPFTKDSIYTAIEIALSNSEKETSEIKANPILRDALFIKENGIYNKINFSDILFLKSDHVYTEIKLFSGELKVIRISLNNMMQQLSEKFIRVHRSYIINYDYLTQIDSSTIKVLDEIIPIGSKYKFDLLNKVNLIK